MFKKLNLIWLPLALSIFGVYAIQRGFAVLDKTIPHMDVAQPLFFTVMSLAVLLGGYLFDNFSSRKVLLGATALGAVGIALVPFTPLGFGLLFGCAAALMKIGPYSSALKLHMFENKNAIVIWPQSAAKNFGGAILIFFVYGLMIKFGWITMTMALASFFILVGLMTYFMLPDDKIDGWKWSVLKELVVDEKFWLISVYFFLMSGFYWQAITEFKGALVAAEYSKVLALNIIASSFVIAGFMRYVVSYIGDKMTLKVNGKVLSARLPLMVIGTFGMGLCVWLLKQGHPLLSLIIFTPMSAIHTPNYWAYCKENWGPQYISTVMGFGYFFMYLGAGIMYGAW